MTLKDFDAANLANQHVTNLSPYKAGMTSEHLAREKGIPLDKIIKLASNENPYGMSPLAAKAMRQALSSTRLYPDNHLLISAISDHLGIDQRQIVLGSGSTEVFDFIARVFLGKGDEAISSQYGFSIYRTFTSSAGADNVIAPAKNYGHDLNSFLGKITGKTKVIWIANPNNPTGTFIAYPDLEAYIKQIPREIIIVLDEAYYEYLSPEIKQNSHQWPEKYPNLIIVRTFSKIHALAGLRVGYGVAHPSVIDLLQRVKQPMNINIAGLSAAAASLKDSEHLQKSYERNQKDLAQIKEGLDDLKLEYLPAFGNFVTVRLDNAAQVNESLLGEGIIVRPLAGYGMPEFVRITAGTPEQNRILLIKLSEILASK